MARAAGDSGVYQLAIIDGAGNPKGRTMELPSVTTILKALPKNGLEWWGYKIGLTEGRRLALMCPPEEFDDEGFYTEVKRLAREDKSAATPATILKGAGGRGTDVHDLAEKLFRDGDLPPKSQIPQEQLPFVEALWAFYKDMGTLKMEVVAIEVPVFSLKHMYAGTLDLILKQNLVDGGVLYHLIDFKTSKGIYESHLIQLAAYKEAAIEMGYIPVGADVVSTVVRLGKTKYQAKNSPATIEDFLAVKQVWQTLQKFA